MDPTWSDEFARDSSSRRTCPSRFPALPRHQPDASCWRHVASRAVTDSCRPWTDEGAAVAIEAVPPVPAISFVVATWRNGPVVGGTGEGKWDDRAVIEKILGPHFSEIYELQKKLVHQMGEEIFVSNDVLCVDG